MSQQFGVTQSLVSWLQQTFNQIFKILGSLPLPREIDFVLVHHDVGVGVDDGPLHVGEGGGAVQHLVCKDSNTPIVTLSSMALTLGKERV